MPCTQSRFRNHCGHGGPRSRGGHCGHDGPGGPGFFHPYHHMTGAGSRFPPFFVMQHDEDDNEVDLAAGPHHFHPHWHMMGPGPCFRPFFGMHHDEDENENAVAADILNDAFQVNRNNNNLSTWDETEERYLFQMDVPGVKARHVTVEEKDGEIEVTAIRMNGEDEVSKTFQEMLYVHPSTSDLTNTAATLKDGVLTITVPKQKDEPLGIPVECATPPVSAEEGKQFRVSMDVPGVKVGSVKLQARNGSVYLETSRKVGGRDITTRRILEVQPSNTNMAEACAFLQDGVLTLVAPIPDKMESSEKKPTSMRIIPVTTEEDDATSPNFASLRLDDANKKEELEPMDKDGMIVEAVSAEEKDWEEVSDDAKKPAKKRD